MKKMNGCSCSENSGNVWVIEGQFMNPFRWRPIFITMTRKEARSKKVLYKATKTRIRKYFSEDVIRRCFGGVLGL
jgi:hypothetical protein